MLWVEDGGRNPENLGVGHPDQEDRGVLPSAGVHRDTRVIVEVVLRRVGDATAEVVDAVGIKFAKMVFAGTGMHPELVYDSSFFRTTSAAQ